MLNKQLLQELYQKWVTKTATAEERDAFLDLLAEVDIEKELGPLLQERWKQKGFAQQSFPEERRVKVLNNILEQYVQQDEAVEVITRRRIRPLQWLAYAAVLALVVAVGVYVSRTVVKPMRKQEAIISAPADSIIPGSNKAVLQLANGTTVNLDSLGAGKIAMQNGKPVFQKQDGGTLALLDVAAVNQKYNSIQVPRGGMYQVILSDGTEVWLNSASSITFPAVFEGSDRQVSISGEVFFNVAKNKAKPFRINVTDHVQVEVLGTQFNVNAYDDEANISTTVIEGSVAVKGKKAARILKPGEQGLWDAKGEGSAINYNVDLHAIIAWKNDEFYFGEKTDIKSVMRQIARWYDVEIEYKSDIEGYFGGSISRKAGIEKTLKMIQKAGGLKIKIEGRKIMVDS